MKKTTVTLLLLISTVSQAYVDPDIWVNPATGTKFTFMGWLEWDQATIACWALGARLPKTRYGAYEVEEEVEEMKALFRSPLAPTILKLSACSSALGTEFPVWASGKLGEFMRAYYVAPITDPGDVKASFTNKDIPTPTVCMSR